MFANRLPVVALLGVLASPVVGQERAIFNVTGLLPVLLTNVEQVVTLGTNPPAGGYQARFRAVVTYPSTRRLYVQEGTHAVQVNLTGAAGGYRPGHWVEVSGSVVPGLPFPRIVKAEASLLGETNLPEPRVTSISRLHSADDAFRWVRVRAVVRDMVSDRNSVTLVGSDGDDSAEFVIAVNNAPLPRDWLDAEIEVHGIAYPFFSERGVPDFFRMHMPALSFVRVVSPGGSNLFERPVMSIAEASRPPWDPQRRRKVIGTVLAQQPANSVFIEDETGPMQVALLWLAPRSGSSQGLEHDAKRWFQPGDRVEVIGVPHAGNSLTPAFIHSEVRYIGTVRPVAPRAVSVRDLRAGLFAGRVVTIEGRLMDQRTWRFNALRRQTFVLKSEEQVFQATWESEIPTSWELKPGSYYRFTGVNDVTRGSSNAPGVFQILLRSRADVVEVPPPAFWRQPEVRRGLLIAAAVGIVAGAFILFQRFHLRRLEHRVERRTVELRDTNSRLQSEATARERAESELRVALESEKELNQLKSSFVSMVSHEFRTPLEIILSCSHILDRYLDRLPPEQRHEQLRAIRKSVHRMSDLMEDVLTLGKFEAARMTCTPAPLDLATLCRRWVDEIASATGEVCPIELNTAGLNGDVNADEGLLGHIVLNLLSNAVKYSSPGRPVEFTVARHGDDARFVVRDSGRGIPAVDMPRLFTAFQRARNVGQIAGSGLGLVIVKRCAELHGGDVHCESEEGRGATFTVTLPLYDGSRVVRRAASG